MTETFYDHDGHEKDLLIPILFASLLTFSQDEFVSLFNGKNLEGWVEKKTPRDKNYIFFRVIDGTIMANSLNNPEHNYAWLYSEKEYGDFELKYKFRAFKRVPETAGCR